MQERWSSMGSQAKTSVRGQVCLHLTWDVPLSHPLLCSVLRMPQWLRWGVEPRLCGSAATLFSYDLFFLIKTFQVFVDRTISLSSKFFLWDVQLLQMVDFWSARETPCAVYSWACVHSRCFFEIPFRNDKMLTNFQKKEILIKTQEWEDQKGSSFLETTLSRLLFSLIDVWEHPEHSWCTAVLNRCASKARKQLRLSAVCNSRALVQGNTVDVFVKY